MTSIRARAGSSSQRRCVYGLTCVSSCRMYCLCSCLMRGSKCATIFRPSSICYAVAHMIARFEVPVRQQIQIDVDARLSQLRHKIIQFVQSWACSDAACRCGGDRKRSGRLQGASMWCRRTMLTPLRARRAAMRCAVLMRGKAGVRHHVHAPEPRPRPIRKIQMSVRARARKTVLSRRRIQQKTHVCHRRGIDR